MLSALITSVVCFLFLGSWSSTFNVLLSIPTSVMGTFAVLYFMGFTLNFFTLLGLSLAIGIVVDDAIMVLENIMRHREMGKSKVLASRDGAREITFAALAATIAVVAIFLPVAFMSGIIGRFFFQFGITISAAVLLSLVEAITVTPMRCSQFMGEHAARLRALGRGAVRQDRRRSIAACSAFCLDHRWLVILVSTAIFVAFARRWPTCCRRNSCRGRTRARSSSASRRRCSSSIAFTEGKLVEAEKILKQHPEIDHFFSAIGGFTTRHRRGGRRGHRRPGQQRADLRHAQAEVAAQRSASSR